jgi:hypothetical protein
MLEIEYENGDGMYNYNYAKYYMYTLNGTEITTLNTSGHFTIESNDWPNREFLIKTNCWVQTSTSVKCTLYSTTNWLELGDI